MANAIGSFFFPARKRLISYPFHFLPLFNAFPPLFCQKTGIFPSVFTEKNAFPAFTVFFQRKKRISSFFFKQKPAFLTFFSFFSAKNDGFCLFSSPKTLNFAHANSAVAFIPLSVLHYIKIYTKYYLFLFLFLVSVYLFTIILLV